MDTREPVFQLVRPTAVRTLCSSGFCEPQTWAPSHTPPEQFLTLRGKSSWPFRPSSLLQMSFFPEGKERNLDRNLHSLYSRAVSILHGARFSCRFGAHIPPDFPFRPWVGLLTLCLPPLNEGC